MIPDEIPFLSRAVAGVSMGAALAFVLISAVVFIALRATRGIVLRRLHRTAGAREGSLQDLVIGLVRSTNLVFLLVVALYCGSLALPLQARAAGTVATIVQIAMLLQLGIWGVRAVLYGIERFIAARPQDEDSRLATAMGAIAFIARIVVWSTIGLLVLNALNINITPLVTGLGIGGVAVALAAQSILGDLFASLCILLDKPFGVGHFIVCGDMAGTIERVGVKSTRIRSLSGEEIVLSNTSLLNSRIHNYRRLFERRVLFGFGVTYDTPYERLKTIPGIVREIIQGIENTRFDRAHFKAYGESSLDFEVVYHVLGADYNLYMDIQQEINLALFRRLEEQGIAFAFPSRTVYLSHATSPAA